MKFQQMVQRLAARRCFNSGQTVTQIAKSAGVSPSTVRRWLKASA